MSDMTEGLSTNIDKKAELPASAMFNVYLLVKDKQSGQSNVKNFLRIMCVSQGLIPGFLTPEPKLLRNSQLKNWSYCLPNFHTCAHETV